MASQQNPPKKGLNAPDMSELYVLSFFRSAETQVASRPANRFSNDDYKDPVTVLTNTSLSDKVPKLRKQHQKYDPYSFIDQMALPFPLPVDPKKKDQKAGERHQDGATPNTKPMPHCKACTDFKTWMELTANPRRHMSKQEREEKQCPLDSELLGSNTWSFLHTMAAYYPEKPSAEQQSHMTKFIKLFAKFYPCQKCASHLREDLKSNTPDTTSNEKLSQWFCELHNRVNVRLGKVEFDCSKVMERWRDGWKDGSCD